MLARRFFHLNHSTILFYFLVCVFLICKKYVRAHWLGAFVKRKHSQDILRKFSRQTTGECLRVNWKVNNDAPDSEVLRVNKRVISETRENGQNERYLLQRLREGIYIVDKFSFIQMEGVHSFFWSHS